MTDKAEGSRLDSSGVGGLSTKEPCGDALKEACRRERDDRAVHDESGSDIAAPGDKTRKKDGLSRRLG